MVKKYFWGIFLTPIFDLNVNPGMPVRAPFQRMDTNAADGSHFHWLLWGP